MSEENVEIVRAVIDAFNRGDLANALDHFAPDAEWHTSGQFADARVYRGHVGIEQLNAELTEELDELSLSTSDARATGDKVFVAATLKGRGRQSGVPFTQAFWYVMTFDGPLIALVVTHLDRDQALEAAGLSE